MSLAALLVLGGSMALVAGPAETGHAALARDAFYEAAERAGELRMVVQAPPAERVEGVAVSPDGRLIASVDNRTVRLWNASGQVLRTFPGDVPISFTSDGAALWVGRGLIHPKRSDSGIDRRTLDGTITKSLTFGRPAGALFDGASFVAIGGSHLNTLAFYDGDGKPLAERPLPSSFVGTVTATSDGALFATNAGDGIAIVRADGTVTARLRGQGEGFGIAFSPDGRTLATGSGGGAVAFHDVAEDGTLKPRNEIQLAPEKVMSLAFGPDGETIHVGQVSGSHWGGAGSVSAYSFKGARAQLLWSSRTSGGSSLSGCSGSPDGKLLAVAGRDTVRVVGIDGRVKWASVEAADSKGWIMVQGVVFSPDGKLLAVSTTSTLTVRSAETGSIVQKFAAPDQAGGGLAFSLDGKKLAVGTHYKGALVFDVDTGQKISAWEIPSPTYKFDGRRGISPRFVPEGGLVAIFDDRLLRVDASGNVLASAPSTPRYDIDGLSVSEDGKRVAMTLEREVALFDGELKPHLRLAARGFPTSVAVSPDGKLVAVGDHAGGLLLYTWEGKLVHTLEGHTQTISGLRFAAAGKLLVSSSADATLRAWNVASGESVIYSASRSEWVAFTPDGYFDASRDGGRLVAAVKGFTAFGVDQFALRNNRPDVLLRRLAVEDEARIAHYHNQYLRRLRKAGLADAAPREDVRVPHAKVSLGVRTGAVQALSIAVDGRGRSLKRYNVFVNDVPIFGALGKPIEGATARIEERVALLAGRNKIEVSCIDVGGVESYRALAWADGPDAAGMPALWFIGFGVSEYEDPSLRLRYASKDVADLADALRKLEGRRFAKVHVHAFKDAAVTPAAIRGARDLLKEARPEDTLVLFIAGHGVHDRDRDATYYFLTHGARVSDLPSTAATFEDVESILQGVAPRQKLFLMDTCESGEADEKVESAQLALAGSRGILSRGLKKKPITEQPKAGPPQRREWLLDRSRYIYNDLQRRSGAIVFSSSRGGELSYEREDLKNGVFTHALVEVLSAGQPVDVRELRERVTKSVAEKTGGLQNPTVDRDNLSARFGF